MPNIACNSTINALFVYAQEGWHSFITYICGVGGSFQNSKKYKKDVLYPQSNLFFERQI